MDASLLFYFPKIPNYNRPETVEVPRVADSCPIMRFFRCLILH